MHFIVIFGPPAVGKMTVGREIEKATGIKLFHNHETIELVLPFFDFGTRPFISLVDSFRTQIFEEVSKSQLKGLIFSFVWDLDSQDDTDFVANACQIFEKVNAEITLVELVAPLDERLVRNRGADRLAAKRSKRDTEKSEQNLLITQQQHRLNSSGKAIALPYKHLIIDSTNQQANETAKNVMQALGLVMAINF